MTLDLSKARIYFFNSSNNSQIAWLFPACYIERKKTHHYILPLKFLKMPWSTIHKQQNLVTSSSAYLRIENLIEPIPTCWNVHPDTLLFRYLSGHVWFAKHAVMLYFQINTNGSCCDNMWHSQKPPH